MNNNTTLSGSSLQTNIVGIDKISLYTPDFHIENYQNSGLTTKKSDVDSKTGSSKDHIILKDKLGTEIIGTSSYINVPDLYQLNIKKYPNSGLTGMQIIYNPSKTLHPFNLEGQGHKLADVWNNIQADLNSKGIKGNWDYSTLSRIDLAMNTSLNNPCLMYSSAMSYLNVVRTKRPSLYPDGYASHNNSRGVNFYNKGKELMGKYPAMIIESLKDNTMRGEYQYKKTKTVSSKLQMGQLKDLHHLDPDYLQSIYKRDMGQDVFRQKQVSTQQVIPFETAKDLLMTFKSESDRTAINRIKSVFGSPVLIELLGSIDAFKHLLTECGWSRNGVNDQVKAVQKDLQIASMIKGRTTDTSKLYRELLYKFAS